MYVAWKFNAPPGWPKPPENWVPSTDWKPDPSWPAAPGGWQFWLPEDPSGGPVSNHATAPHPSADPLPGLRRPGDLWAAVGKPLTGMGAVKVRMDHVHLFVERGLISTDAQQIPLAWVVDVDAAQSPPQKLRGVGTIRVRINRGGTLETMTLGDLEDFRLGVETINRAARDARVAETQLQHTQHVNYAGAPPHLMAQPMAAPPQTAHRSSSDEILSSIERLGHLHQSGALTDEEFTRKKAELLRQL